MLKKIIRAISERHHPWRKMKFDELAEIYTSMSLRSFGFGIIGIFVPIYLYKNGITLEDLFLFYTAFFLMRIPITFVAGFIVGRIGPKHTIAISTILIVAFLGLLVSYGYLGWPLLFLAFVYSVSNGLFFLAYNTDFSKVKDSKNGGKELGWLYIFERGGGALGPFVGGLLATLVSPEVTIMLAIIVLLCSLIPLFLTNEPVRTHQKITYKGFRWQRHTFDFVSLSAFNVENVASGVMWPLFAGVAIFTEDTYAKIGGIIALAMVISMFSARMYGKFIDNNKGLFLLQYGSIMNSGVHVIRPFITTGSGVVAISTLNEPMTLSYRMPLIKGFYDAADSEEGYRIVYLTVADMVVAVAKGLFCLGLLVASYFYDPLSVLRYSFIIVAFISLGILLQRFPALKRV